MRERSDASPEPRSAGALPHRRVPLPWPEDRDFRILSIDGGGIRGILPAAILARLEDRHTQGKSIGNYFDLICGTSTGGIISLGLAAGYPAQRILDLYLTSGRQIFPPLTPGIVRPAARFWRSGRQLAFHRYKRDVLIEILEDLLQQRTLEESHNRLCIPAFEGAFGEVYIFKTPHHPDYQNDRHDRMIDVALATAAAPTYFSPIERRGYLLVDGGVWANNPTMIGLVDAMSCFDVNRHQIRIMSLGCSGHNTIVTAAQAKWGGKWHWKSIINAAMNLQSQNALGQAGLLVGAERVLRIDAPATLPPIELDDWERSKSELPPQANILVERYEDQILQEFLQSQAVQFQPTAPALKT